MASSSRSVPDTSQWYKIKDIRVQHAQFSYRKSTDTEWTDLEISLAEPGFTTDFNVEQVRIFGGGIELLQRWLLYDAPRQGKGGVLEVDTDHYRWKVAFKKGQFKDVVVREFEIPTRRCLFVELRFTCTAAPDSADATISVIPAPEDEEEDKDEAKDAAEVVEAEVEPTEQDDEMDEGEVEDDPSTPDTSQFPVAKLFAVPDTIPGLQIRLVFPRAHANTTKSYSWVWPAVIFFLAGRDEWTPMVKKSVTAQKYGTGNWRLDKEFAGNPDQVAALAKRRLRDDETLEWQLNFKAPPPVRPSASAAVFPIRTKESTEPLKRKREVANVSEAALQAKKAALDKADQVYENAYNKRMDMGKEIEEDQKALEKKRCDHSSLLREEQIARANYRALREEVRELEEAV